MTLVRQPTGRASCRSKGPSLVVECHGSLTVAHKRLSVPSLPSNHELLGKPTVFQVSTIKMVVAGDGLQFIPAPGSPRYRPINSFTEGETLVPSIASVATNSVSVFITNRDDRFSKEEAYGMVFITRRRWQTLLSQYLNLE